MAVWIAFAGLCLTVMLAFAGLAYQQGHQAARVEELEKWRHNMRADMHEISNTLQRVSVDIRDLTRLVMERTDRRAYDRASTGLRDD